MTLDFSLYEIFIGSLYAVLLGSFFGFTYDFIRLIRVLLGTVYQGRFIKGPFSKRSAALEAHVTAFRARHPMYRTFLKHLDAVFDFLYLVFCAIAYAVFLYAVNHGIFRFAFLFGSIFGFFLYRKTVGRIFFFLLREMAAFLYLLMQLISKIICFLLIKPIKKIFLRIFFPICRKILLLFRKKHDIINNKETNL